MSDQPEPVPSQKKSLVMPWILWLAAAALLPALPFLAAGKKALDDGSGAALILLAMAAQLACSIWLAILLAARGEKGSGFVVLMAFLLMFASIAIGTASFFASCLAVDYRMDFK